MSQLILPKNVLSKPVIEYRAMPTLLEQRNNLITNMENLVKKAKEETRAFNDDEQAEFNKAKADIEAIDKTIQAEQTAQTFAKSEQVKSPEAEQEERAFEDKLIRFIQGDTRALDVAGNGSIIPTLIADRIIQRVRQLSPIYARSTVFNIGGDLVFPTFDYASINVAYVSDMTELVAQNGNFSTIKLQNFIAGALVTVSRSLMNRTDFDLVNFIVNNMAMAIARFLENQLLNGTGTASMTGIFVDTNVTQVVGGSATAISLDDLISVQMAVPQPFQNDAIWIMSSGIFSSLRKLKDTTGMPLLLQNSRSVEQGFGWELLGKPVYVSENAPSTLGTGLNVLAYGDMAGMYIKLAQNVEIQVLNEKYATQHAIGVVGYVEADSRVVEGERIARLRLA